MVFCNILYASYWTTRTNLHEIYILRFCYIRETSLFNFTLEWIYGCNQKIHCYIRERESIWLHACIYIAFNWYQLRDSYIQQHELIEKSYKFLSTCLYACMQAYTHHAWMCMQGYLIQTTDALTTFFFVQSNLNYNQTFIFIYFLMYV